MSWVASCSVVVNRQNGNTYLFRCRLWKRIQYPQPSLTHLLQSFQRPLELRFAAFTSLHDVDDDSELCGTSRRTHLQRTLRRAKCYALQHFAGTVEPHKVHGLWCEFMGIVGILGGGDGGDEEGCYVVFIEEAVEV